MILFRTDIYPLTTDFDFHVLDQDLTDPVQPAESVDNGTGGSGDDNVIQLHTQVRTVNQITVAANQASYLAREVGLAVDGLSPNFR